MLPSERKLVFESKSAKLWEVFDRDWLKQLNWSEETLRLGNVYRTIDLSDRVGVVTIRREIVGAVGFWVSKMQPTFWFAATDAAKLFPLELVRFFSRLKREYPHFVYTRQNDRLLKAVERWASSQAAD